MRLRAKTRTFESVVRKTVATVIFLDVSLPVLVHAVFALNLVSLCGC